LNEPSPSLKKGGGTPAGEVRQRTVRGKLVNPNLDLDRTSQLDALDDQARFNQK